MSLSTDQLKKLLERSNSVLVNRDIYCETLNVFDTLEANTIVVESIATDELFVDTVTTLFTGEVVISNGGSKNAEFRLLDNVLNKKVLLDTIQPLTSNIVFKDSIASDNTLVINDTNLISSNQIVVGNVTPISAGYSIQLSDSTSAGYATPATGCLLYFDTIPTIKMAGPKYISLDKPAYCVLQNIDLIQVISTQYPDLYAIQELAFNSGYNFTFAANKITYTGPGRIKALVSLNLSDVTNGGGFLDGSFKVVAYKNPTFDGSNKLTAGTPVVESTSSFYWVSGYAISCSVTSMVELETNDTYAYTISRETAGATIHLGVGTVNVLTFSIGQD